MHLKCSTIQMYVLKLHLSGTKIASARKGFEYRLIVASDAGIEYLWISIDFTSTIGLRIYLSSRLLSCFDKFFEKGGEEALSL